MAGRAIAGGRPHPSLGPARWGERGEKRKAWPANCGGLGRSARPLACPPPSPARHHCQTRRPSRGGGTPIGRRAGGGVPAECGGATRLARGGRARAGRCFLNLTGAGGRGGRRKGAPRAGEPGPPPPRATLRYQCKARSRVGGNLRGRAGAGAAAKGERPRGPWLDSRALGGRRSLRFSLFPAPRGSRDGRPARSMGERGVGA